MKKRSHPTARQRGFALVVALSLMAFILMLLLSITTLVRVETSASEIAQAKVRAEQNALLGLAVALGELQRAAGPDQRVTARAEILDADPTTPDSDGVENPHWLAVYKSVQAGSEQQSLEALRAWATDGSVAGRVDWLVSSRVPFDGGMDPAGTDAVALNGGDPNNVVTMVRYTDQAGNPLDVRAGKVPVSDVNADTGHFAWWVADESAKFRINLVKESTVLDGEPFEPRWALKAPHQSNPALVSALSSFDVSDTEQQERLGRSLSPDTFQLVDPSWATWAKENGDAFTLVSRSIPVDVTQGRLKQDLTVYLETNASGLSDSDHIVRGGATDPDYQGRLGTGSFQMNYDDVGIPQFGLLKSWYEGGMQISGFDGGTAPEPQAHRPDQHGLHPVILRTAVYYGVSFEVNAADPTRVTPVFLVYPKFVLWNPHNVPIAPAKYVVQVRSMTTLNTQINIGGENFAARNVTQGFNYRGNIVQGNNSFAHGNLANPQPPTLARDPDDDFPYLTFVIDTVGFAPGETLLFTGSDKHPNSEYVNTTIDSVPTSFANHNLLVNENEGNLGFFFLRGNENTMVGLPTNPSDPAPETDEGDELQAAFYFRDTHTNSPLGSGQIEPSLSSKLYLYNGPGDVELLEFIDFVEAIGPPTVGWEHINTRGQSVSNDPLTQIFRYPSLSTILSDPFQANYQRGHGYFLTPMASDDAEHRIRPFVRYNPAVSKKRVDDALSTTAWMYVQATPTQDWFNGTYFRADIPKEDTPSYQNLQLNGYGTPGSYGLYDVSSAFTQGTVYSLYDRVRAETGLLSLGFLKNVNFSQRYLQPAFAFGNSEAHTHVARNAIQEVHGGARHIDLSYLLNESLWDRFFLSTIPQTSAFTPSHELRLPNTRNRLVPDRDGNFPDVAALRASPTAFETAAASIAVEGGFNVNSTSVDAWRMFLSSHLGESVTTGDDSISNSLDRVPFGSKAYPLIAEVPGITNGPSVWSALRSLSGDEIDALAEAMVEEVKRRGPFLSLADFVNRRLVPDSSDREDDYLGLKGTLQAAIDKVTAAGTVPLNEPFHQGILALPHSAIQSSAAYPEHETGLPSGEVGSRMFGVPGYLTQADVLSALGSVLTVRGDTFTIRAYGESVEGVSGKVEARIWCEAVVQRVADPVDQNDSIVQPEGPFGRSFRILSLRWFTEDDII